MGAPRQKRLKPRQQKIKTTSGRDNWRTILLQLSRSQSRRNTVETAVVAERAWAMVRPGKTRVVSMTVSVPNAQRSAKTKSNIAKDFQEHLAALEARGLVVRVDRP